MRLDPLHPAAWVLDHVRDAGWQVHDLLTFTRASTLILVSRYDDEPVVIKAGFGSNHVLAELDDRHRPAAYGFYWYAEMTQEERQLSRADFQYERDLIRDAGNEERHVVPLIAEGHTERFDWYAMPYLPEGNFKQLLTGEPGPDQETRATGLGILADVAAGLQTLNDHGIVHRDVYQENILLRNGRGLITDLGAARRLHAPRGPVRRGPEVHWPPEYATGYDHASPAADVFSLAVLTYRFLCGDLPRPQVHPTVTALPSFLRVPLLTALSRRADDRPSMNELHDALRNAAAENAPRHS